METLLWMVAVLLFCELLLAVDFGRAMCVR